MWKMTDFRHIVVVRLAMKKLFVRRGVSWDEWVKRSIELYDTFLRPSLKRQTNQNFTILSLANEHLSSIGDMLDNEIWIKTGKGHGLIQSINEQFVSNEKNLLITRIDRDDAVSEDFIEIVQERAKNDIAQGITSKYYDICDVYKYDTETGDVMIDDRYNTMCSPFVTVLERPSKEEKIRCQPYSTPHTKIPTFVDGEKIKELKALQVIHGGNVLNKMKGVLIETDKDFLKRFIG